MQNMITGRVGSSGAGVNPPRYCARFPCWKIQTIAPNEVAMESRFMITALSGSTTDPSSRKSTT